MSAARKSPNVDRILSNIGIDPSSRGTYVLELRKSIEGRGLSHMGVSWGPMATSDEEKARALLEAEWSIERGHYCKTEVMDCYPINRRFDTRSMRYHYEFRPDRILPLVRDKLRWLAMQWRIFRDRSLLRLRNPYST